MSRPPTAPQLLPIGCLLCGAPYVTAEWRATPTPYGVIYVCDDCCQRLGPRKALLMARHFLQVLTRLAYNLHITGALPRPVHRDGEP
jgi:hypothetical protein